MDFWEQFIAVLSRITDPLSIPFNSWERMYWLYLVGAALLAIPIFRAKKNIKHSIGGFINFMLPKEVFLHRSAKVDYLFLFLNRFIMLVLVLPFLLGSDLVSSSVEQAWLALGPPFFSLEPSLTLSIIYTVALVVAFDFALFIAHYWFHKIPILWEFHKVHHSAEVLTPVTIYRFHPVDDGVSMIVISLLSGAVSGTFQHFVQGELQYVSILGVNSILFFYYVFGYNLRHSHIWLSYGPFWSKLLISPAQHQIHHSKAKPHWDKNFGFIFAIWDVFFKTLYVPKEKEDIQFGLSGDEHKEFQSPLRLYFLPFAKSAKLIRKRFKKR